VWVVLQGMPKAKRAELVTDLTERRQLVATKQFGSKVTVALLGAEPSDQGSP